MSEQETTDFLGQGRKRALAEHLHEIVGRFESADSECVGVGFDPRGYWFVTFIQEGMRCHITVLREKDEGKPPRRNEFRDGWVAGAASHGAVGRANLHECLFELPSGELIHGGTENGDGTVDGLILTAILPGQNSHTRIKGIFAPRKPLEVGQNPATEQPQLSEHARAFPATDPDGKPCIAHFHEVEITAFPKLATDRSFRDGYIAGAGLQPWLNTTGGMQDIDTTPPIP